jgi:hypothetical protein
MIIARLKITLDDVKPAVTRHIEVPFDIKLSDLHLVIQAAMPWDDCHLYEFRARNTRWGIPNPDWDWGESPLDARKVTLHQATEDAGTKILKYLYDFGDGWEHKVKIEKTGEPEPDTSYPRLVDASGRCPPEDAGGPWGYAEYLEALAGPDHERHDEMVEWRGPGFDPNAVDIAGIEKDLAALARRASRRKAKGSSKKA